MGQMTDCWMISINPKSEGSDGEGDVQQWHHIDEGSLHPLQHRHER
jgi:hypothetical protein